MFWNWIVFGFFSLGTILAFIENGSELSLWFLAFGWVLDLTLLLLTALRSPKLRKWLNNPTAMASHIVAMLLWLSAFILRSLPRVNLFKVLIVLASLLWLISVILPINPKPKKRSIDYA